MDMFKEIMNSIKGINLTKKEYQTIIDELKMRQKRSGDKNEEKCKINPITFDFKYTIKYTYKTKGIFNFDCIKSSTFKSWGDFTSLNGTYDISERQLYFVNNFKSSMGNKKIIDYTIVKSSINRRD